MFRYAGAALLLALLLAGCGRSRTAQPQTRTVTQTTTVTQATTVTHVVTTSVPATTPTTSSAPVAGRTLLVGAVEDEAKFSPTNASARADLARAGSAGFRAIAFSAFWQPGRTALPHAEVDGLRRAVRAAAAASITPVVDVAQFSGNTPLTDKAQMEFASFAASVPRLVPGVEHIIVGNEPNTNLFWLPQFDASGGDAAARAYQRLLARSYDAVKAVSPDVEVIGGGLAARGADRPNGLRPTHSPVAFIRDLGTAYRESGRSLPVMDAFSMHVYGSTSRVPPTVAHPRGKTIGIADYDKLESLLRDAFGRTVPIVYGEYGVDTTISPDKRAAYTGSELASNHPADPMLQARYYAEAIRMAACQPLVEMLLFFHVTDEPQLDRLQTGVYYADHTPKPGFDIVARAAREAAAGAVPCAR